jgi:hypothetical protein
MLHLLFLLSLCCNENREITWFADVVPLNKKIDPFGGHKKTFVEGLHAVVGAQSKTGLFVSIS